MDTYDQLMTKKPAEAVQFCSRREATAAARSIGFPAKDAAQIDVMGFALWTIMDDHMSMVRASAFPGMQRAREGHRPWRTP